MVNIKEAIVKAMEYFDLIYDDKKYSDLQLEEVELSEDSSYWLITLGYRVPLSPKSHGISLLEQAMAPTIYNKEYKILKIKSDTGDVVSMKIRQLT